MKLSHFFNSLLLCLATSISISASSEAVVSSFELTEKQTVTLTLPHAINAAITSHPSVKSATIDVEIAKITEKAAWAGYLPSINVATSIHGDKNSGTSQVNATISGSQYLIGFSGPRERAKQAEVDTKIADISKNTLLQQRRALTESLFLNAWLKQEEKKLLEMQFQASKDSLNQAKRKFETGLITGIDYKAQIAQTSSIESALDSHTEQLRSVICELEEITGLALSNDRGVYVKLMWQPNVDQTIKPISFYAEIALDNRLELEINKATRQRALADEKLAKGKLLPSISAVGEFSCGYTPGNTPENATSDGFLKSSFFAGVQANWNIFDRNSSKFEAEIARAKALKANTDREVLKKKIKKEIAKIHSELTLAQKQAKSLQAQLAATTSAQEQTDQQFAVGLITKAQASFSEAETYKTQFACLSQVVSFERSLCSLNAACGYAPEITQELSS